MKYSDVEQIAEFLRFLAHPLRIKIVLLLLEKEECCVRRLQEKLKRSQPNISQHLNILRLGKVVCCKQVGKTRCYTLKNPMKIRRLLEILTDLVND